MIFRCEVSGIGYEVSGMGYQEDKIMSGSREIKFLMGKKLIYTIKTYLPLIFIHHSTYYFAHV